MYTFEEIIDAFLNGGHCYAVATLDPAKIKIGKTSLHSQRKDVETDLLKRYDTVYPGHARILQLIEVGNCHVAEKSIFHELKHIPHIKEVYQVDDVSILGPIFKHIKERYPPWMDMIGKIEGVNEQVEMMTKVNQTIRALDLHKVNKNKNTMVRFRDIVL